MDIEALEKLAALKEKGILTPEEFESMKKQIIGGGSVSQPQTQPKIQTPGPQTQPQPRIQMPGLQPFQQLPPEIQRQRQPYQPQTPQQYGTYYSQSPTPNEAYYVPSISMWHYFVECITDKAFDFNGRARRKEFWGFVIFNSLFAFLIGLILAVLGASENVISSFSIIYQLIFLIPYLAVIVRRLHDCNISGKWLLWPLFIAIGLGVLAAIGAIISYATA